MPNLFCNAGAGNHPLTGKPAGAGGKHRSAPQRPIVHDNPGQQQGGVAVDHIAWAMIASFLPFKSRFQLFASLSYLQHNQSALWRSTLKQIFPDQYDKLIRKHAGQPISTWAKDALIQLKSDTFLCITSNNLKKTIWTTRLDDYQGFLDSGSPREILNRLLLRERLSNMPLLVLIHNLHPSWLKNIFDDIVMKVIPPTLITNDGAYLYQRTKDIKQALDWALCCNIESLYDSYDQFKNTPMLEFRTPLLYPYQPIHIAAMTDNVTAIEKILQVNPDAIHAETVLLNSYDSDYTKERTPLHCAAHFGRIHAAKTLLQQGAQVAAPNHRAQTALHIAADNGHLELIDLLLAHGANINADNTYKVRAVHISACNQDATTLNHLIQRGASIDAKDCTGQTPLIYAARRDDTESAKLLLQYGAAVDAVDNEGNTALHEAATHRIFSPLPLDTFVPIVKLLLNAGAAPNAGNSGGITPLSIALRNQDYAIVDAMMAFKPDMTRINHYFKIPSTFSEDNYRINAFGSYSIPDECKQAQRNKQSYDLLIKYDNIELDGNTLLRFWENMHARPLDPRLIVALMQRNQAYPELNQQTARHCLAIAVHHNKWLAVSKLLADFDIDLFETMTYQKCQISIMQLAHQHSDADIVRALEEYTWLQLYGEREPNYQQGPSGCRLL